MFDAKLKLCTCERCGHNWTTKTTEPRSCAKCKSVGWNKPRVYAGQYVSGTLSRRFLPTGRAAAKLKPERLAAANIKKNLKLSEYFENIYKHNRDLIHSHTSEFRKFYLYPIVSQLEDSRQKLKILSFEYAELVETEDKEIFYRKRGSLYTVRSQITDEIEQLENHLYKEDQSGCFQDYDRDSISRYELFLSWTEKLKSQLKECEMEIDELNENFF